MQLNPAPREQMSAQNARAANAASTCRIGGAGVVRAELQLGLEIGAPRRMVPFLSAKSRIAWYNFLMIRFLNARNRLYFERTLQVRRRVVA